jgi:PhnB protein
MKEGSMAEQSVRAAAQKITPHIVVHDGPAAVDWYTRVLGAREGLRIELPNGKLLVELRFDDTLMMLADEFPEMGIVSPRMLGATYMALYLTVEDVDDVWQRARDAGAEVFVPLGDSFWGDRQGQIIDPFGHRWGFSQHLREVPPEEIKAAAIAAFGG